MKGTSEEGTARGKEGREKVSGGEIERGAWEQGREGNFKRGSIFTKRPLPLRLWYYK